MLISFTDCIYDLAMLWIFLPAPIKKCINIYIYKKLRFILSAYYNVFVNNIDFALDTCVVVLSILVVWLECRFLEKEVDGPNPGISMLCP